MDRDVREWIVRSAVLAAVIGLLTFWIIPRAIGHSFEQSVWKSRELVKQGHRLAMADWFINWRTLDGMSRAELLAMLGEPDEDWSSSVGEEWRYYLGPARLRFDGAYEWLSVRFTPDGRVATYQIDHNFRQHPKT
jgi:hypothetical protein